MKLKEILLATENMHGEEVNYLTTIEDYTKEWLIPCCESKEEVAEVIMQLFTSKPEHRNWTSIYATASKSVDVKFCQNESDLRLFLMGKTNSDNVKWYVDENKCHPKCKDILKQIGMGLDGRGSANSYHYERIYESLEQGLKIPNLNGQEFRILEKLSEENLLLMNHNTGEFLVGVGTRYYVRMPREEQENEAVKQYGVEWNHGVYLGNRLENINLMSIYERYADRPYSMGIHMQVEQNLAKQEKETYEERTGGRR